MKIKIFIFVLISFLLVDCKKDKPDQNNTDQENVVDVSGSIIQSDFGTGNIFANTLLTQDVTVSSSSYSVKVSNLGAQLILLTRDDRKLKGLTFSYLQNNYNVIYPGGIESTALSVILLTPGICTTNSDSLIQRITRIKNLSSFTILKNYIKDNSEQTDLGQVCKSEIFQNKLNDCIQELVAFNSKCKGTKSTDYDNDLYFSANRVNASEVTLKNNNFRFVQVYRQELFQNGSEKKTPTLVKESMGGAESFDYGQVLHPLEIPATIENDETYSTVTSEVTQCKYWVLGMGFSPTQNQVPPSIVRNSTTADLCTTVFYIVFPIVDFVAGLNGLGVPLKGKQAIDFVSCVKDGVGVIQALHNFQNSNSLSESLETGINLSMILINQAVDKGCFVKIGLPSIQDALLGTLMSLFGTVFGASNLIVWFKLICWDTPPTSYYVVDPLYATQLYSPIDGATTELTPKLSCYVYTNGTSYRFQLSKDQSFNTFIINDVSNLPSYQLNPGTLNPGNTYYWKVRTSTSIGEISPWSNIWHFTAGETGLLVKPTLLDPQNNSVNISLSPNFDWEDVNDATLYSFLLDINETFSFPIINQTNLTSSDYQLQAGILQHSKKYYWKANAINSTTTSEWSDTWSFTTKSPNPSDVILPLAVGNYWIYLPDITPQTMTISITGTINVQGETCYKWYAQGDPYEWYYKNKSDGCWAYGYSGPEQYPPDLEYKYPANFGDTWVTNWIAVPYPTRMTCESTTATFESYSGCYKFHYLFPFRKDNFCINMFKNELFDKMSDIESPKIDGYDIYQYFIPGIGLVGWELYYQGIYMYKVVLTDYHLNK